MSRDAVWKLLGNDSELQTRWGIDQNRVFPNYGINHGHGSPKEGYFLILRWEEITASRSNVKGLEVLTVWAHISRHTSTDFVPLKKILFRVRQILTSNYHVAGEDGYTMTSADFTGEGRDLHDTGFDTMTRNAAFEVLARPTAA